jgi:hypothetical protein
MAVDTIVTKIRSYIPTLLNEPEAGARARGDVADWHGSCQSTVRDENQSAHSELPNIRDVHRYNLLGRTSQLDCVIRALTGRGHAAVSLGLGLKHSGRTQCHSFVLESDTVCSV